MKGLLRATRLLAVAVLLVAACGESVSPTDSDQTQVEFEAGPLGAVEVAPGERIQIRSLNSISGDIAFLGIPNQRGVEMAIEDYGPVAGREVSMGTPLDDLCSPDGGQSGAQATVADPSVVGVIGTTCSSAAVAASPLISDAGMVMIAPSNTSPADSSRARTSRLSSVAVRKQISLSGIDKLRWRLPAPDCEWESGVVPERPGFGAPQGIGPARRRSSW